MSENHHRLIIPDLETDSLVKDPSSAITIVVEGGSEGTASLHDEEEESSSSSTALIHDSSSFSPATLVFNKVTTSFTVSQVSGVASPGEILAVMGPTGCGKTTLLNAISGRTPSEGHSEILVNGEPCTRRIWRTRFGYVLQHDLFFPTLTLRETLTYTALLRVSDVHPESYKLAKVEEIIGVLDLVKCADTLVGNDVTVRGLSGGERKRLSIAVELITDPAILLIDEPTSGLDSHTAIHLISTLKAYACARQKTVVLTVHQPSSRMFHMFDNLLALSGGRTAFFGPAREMRGYMKGLGLEMEVDYNPADFLLEVLKDEEGSQKVVKAWTPKEVTTKVKALDSDRSSPVSSSSSSSSGSSHSTWQTSFLTQVRVLTRRNIKLALPRIFASVNVVQTLALALMAGFIWFRTERTEENLDNLEGWMFFSCNFYMLFALFQALWAFEGSGAKPIVLKERKSGAYRFSSFYVSKLLGEVPLEVALPSVYFLISYLLIGGSVLSTLGVLVSQVLSSLASVSVGVFFSAVLDTGSATTAASVFTVGAQLLGGYLTKAVPPYLKIFSLVYNGWRNLQLAEYYGGVQIACAKSSSAFESCQRGGKWVDPEELMRRGGGNEFPLWAHSLVLIAFIFVFRCLAFCAWKRQLK